MNAELNADDLHEAETGDELTIDYESVHAERGNEQTLEATVVSIDQTVSRDGEFTWTTLLLSEDEDDLPRRRLKVIPGGSTILENRSTTIEGAVWSRMARGDSTVYTLDLDAQAEDDETEAEDEFEQGDEVCVEFNEAPGVEAEPLTGTVTRVDSWRVTIEPDDGTEWALETIEDTDAFRVYTDSQTVHIYHPDRGTEDLTQVGTRATVEREQDDARADGGEDEGNDTAEPDYSLTDAERALFDAQFGERLVADGGEDETEDLPRTYDRRAAFSIDVRELDHATLVYESSAHGAGEQTVEGVVHDAHLSEWFVVEGKDGHTYRVYGLGVADREAGDVVRDGRKVGEFARATRHGPVRADGSGERRPALVNVTEDDPGNYAFYAAHEDVSLGDEASVTFDNSFDLRHADETTVRGEVVVVAHDVDHAGTVVLRIEGEDRRASVTHGRGVFVGEPGSTAGHEVGRVVSSEWCGPAQSDAADGEDREVCTDGGVVVEDGGLGATLDRAGSVDDDAPRAPAERRDDLATMRHERLESLVYHLRLARVRCERGGRHDLAHTLRVEREAARTELTARAVDRHARDRDDGRDLGGDDA